MQYGSRPTSEQQLATWSRIAEGSVTLAVFSEKGQMGICKITHQNPKGGHRGRRDLTVQDEEFPVGEHHAVKSQLSGFALPSLN